MEMLIFLTNNDPWIKLKELRELADGKDLYMSSWGMQVVMHSIGDGKGEYVYTFWKDFAGCRR